MPHHRTNVKADLKARELAADLAGISTGDLWNMLQLNLSRLTAAWEGHMTVRDQEQRVRLCAAIAKEIRSRGMQLRIEF